MFISEESINEEGWAKELGSLDLCNFRKNPEYTIRTISYRSFCFITCFFDFWESCFAIVEKITKITCGTFPNFLLALKRNRNNSNNKELL